MSNVLVTGATGFLGRNLIIKLRQLGYDVYAISKNGGQIGDVEVVPIDCTRWNDLQEYCSGKSFDAVIHLAALIHSKIWQRENTNISLQKNVAMVLNILGIVSRNQNTNFVYGSSVSVYGDLGKATVTEDMPANPSNPYSLGKYFGELACQSYQRMGIPIAILRIAAPYGNGMHDTVIRKFIMKAMLSQDLPLFKEGEHSQDFVYIDDIVGGILMAFQVKASGVFNISSGRVTTMRELADTVLRVVPYSKSKIVHLPVDDPESNRKLCYAYSKAKIAFGYQPEYSLEDGIRKTAEAMGGL